jgi:hypothetical protein
VLGVFTVVFLAIAYAVLRRRTVAAPAASTRRA